MLLLALAAAAPAAAQTARPDVERALAECIEAVARTMPEVTLAVAVRAPGVSVSRLGGEALHAASTMKVPVMIEAFRQVEAGRFAWDTPIPVRNAFRSVATGDTFAITADSDDALYERLGAAVALDDLVERAITRSSNLATNVLIDLLAADSVQATVDRLGAPGMRVRRGVEDLAAFERGLNNETTADALAVLLVALRDGRAVSPEADAAMRAILARQTFREMIPAGLPEGTPVAHKTGWITRIHHDAGIVSPPGIAPYVLVVLTHGAETHDASARLGAAVSRAVFNVLSGDAAGG